MKAGTVVITYFPGVVVSKRRPALIVSSDVYNADRPDFIVAVVSSQVAKSRSRTDYILKDWEAAGLNSPSFVRLFLFSVPQHAVKEIGNLSAVDWKEVRSRLSLCFDHE